MDILRFVNSKAIREHLRSINYQFNTLEAAYLIAFSRNITYDEKHYAWKEVIETMPDMSPNMELPNCNWKYYSLSIHRFLKELMEQENALLQEYLSIKDGTFKFQSYGYDCEHGYNKYQEHGEFGVKKTSADEMKAYVLDWLETDSDDSDDFFKDFGIIGYRIICKRKNSDIEYVAVYNIKGQLKAIYTIDDAIKSNGLFFQFNDMWLDIPTPFKKGDILYDPWFPESSHMWTGPFVFEKTAAEHYKQMGLEGGKGYKDMSVYGYFQDEKGNYYKSTMTDYLSLEYYPIEEIRGFNRALVALSHHLKEKIDDVLFAKAYHYILTNEYANITKPEYFTDEGLRLAGIKTEEDIKYDTDDLPF